MEQFAMSQINLPTTHGNGDIYGTCITRIVEYFIREEKVQDNQSSGSDRINVSCSLIILFKILCHSHQIRQLEQFNLFVCSSSSYKFAYNSNGWEITTEKDFYPVVQSLSKFRWSSDHVVRCCCWWYSTSGLVVVALMDGREC